MTVRPEWSATDRQRSFLNGLIEERVMPQKTHDDILAIVERDDFSKIDATRIIGEFVKLPKKAASRVGRVSAKTSTASPGSVSPLTGEVDPETPGSIQIAALQLSRFAIPVSELGVENTRTAGHSTLLFGEVREWKGHRFINALKGSPGSFSRVRLRGRDKWEIVAILEKDQLKYTQLYGKHYKCCGSCGAELSDEISRKLVLGPECRKKYGY